MGRHVVLYCTGPHGVFLPLPVRLSRVSPGSPRLPRCLFTGTLVMFCVQICLSITRKSSVSKMDGHGGSHIRGRISASAARTRSAEQRLLLAANQHRTAEVSPRPVMQPIAQRYASSGRPRSLISRPPLDWNRTRPDVGGTSSTPTFAIQFTLDQVLESMTYTPAELLPLGALKASNDHYTPKPYDSIIGYTSMSAGKSTLIAARRVWAAKNAAESCRLDALRLRPPSARLPQALPVLADSSPTKRKRSGSAVA